MKFRGFFRPLTAVLATIVLACVAAPAALAEQDYIGLRSGPSDAYPVIFEVSDDRTLRPLVRRGSWLKMTDERNAGWLHVDELHRVRSMPADEMWMLINDARPGTTRVEFSLASQSSYALGVLGRVYGLDAYLRHTRNPEGYTSWSLTETGYVMKFSTPADTVRLQADVGLGVALQSDGNEYWGEDTDAVPVLTGGADVIWASGRYFEIGARGFVGVSLNEELNVRPGAALLWRIRI